MLNLRRKSLSGGSEVKRSLAALAVSLVVSFEFGSVASAGITLELPMYDFAEAADVVVLKHAAGASDLSPASPFYASATVAMAPRDEAAGAAPRDLAGAHAILARIASPAAVRLENEESSGDSASAGALGRELAGVRPASIAVRSLAKLDLTPASLVAIEPAIDPVRSAPRTIASSPSDSHPLLSLAAVVPLAPLPR